MLPKSVQAQCLILLFYPQKYPPSATTLHFEFYADPGAEVKIEKRVSLIALLLFVESLSLNEGMF